MDVSVRARGAVLLSATCLLATAAPALAAATGPRAERTAEVCAGRAGLHQAPGGAVVGVVHRGDVLRLLPGRRAQRGWVAVRARFGTRGWIRTRSLCDGDGGRA